MSTNVTRYLPALFLAAALPMAAQAMDSNDAAAKQVATATAHAGMAMGAANLKMTHAHLHHVVNCLVGPNGKGFDTTAEDPCKGMGDGAIVDAKGDAAMEARLHKALGEAEKGLQAQQLSSARADAKTVMGTLQAR